jgi:hypothetical protein
VTVFRCTVDDGGVIAPIPNYIGFCGDPPSLPLPLPIEN